MSLKRLFQCLWLVLGSGIGVTTTPSSSTPIIPSIASSSTTSSVRVTVPTPPSFLQHNNVCRTGPQFDISSLPGDFNTNRIAVTDHIYLDISEPVPCSGVITRWHYCYFVIGFHNVSSGLQPCVWRRSTSPIDSIAGYEKIGCNEFSIIPGERDGLQCQYFVPLSHSDFIRVEEGDYIGFYVPDAGLFLPFSSPEDDDTNRYQQQRITMGFSHFIKDSELRNVTTHPGRALLSAEIDTFNILFPSATISSSSSSALIPTLNPMPRTSIASSIVQVIKSQSAQSIATITESTAVTSAEPVITTAAEGTVSTVLLVSVGVVVPSAIAFIVVMVTTSIVCVYCKKYLKYKRFHSDTAELLPKLLENPAYSMASQNHVMIGNQLTLIDCTNNQAYNHGMVGKLETVVQVKNQAYNIVSANHITIGRQRTTVDLSENPAYDPTTHHTGMGMGQPKRKTHDQRPISIASSRQLLEHTYESLSPHYNYAHPYHKLS